MVAPELNVEKRISNVDPLSKASLSQPGRAAENGRNDFLPKIGNFIPLVLGRFQSDSGEPKAQPPSFTHLLGLQPTLGS